MTGVTKSAVAVVLTLSLIPLVGCDTVTSDFVTEEAADTDFRCVGIGCGGPTFNTNIVGATAVSHLSGLGGSPVNGVALRRVLTAGGVQLETIWSQGGRLFGFGDNILFEPSDLVGSRFYLSVDEPGPGFKGETHYFLLDSTWADDEGVQRYVFRDLTAWDGSPNDAPPTCQPVESANVDAVVFEGISLDLDSGKIDGGAPGFFIACVGGAMGKVAVTDMGWGYHPFDVGLEGYKSAVRAARADYCGDGNSWTVTGTPLLLRDNMGVHPNPFSTTYNEAAWDAEGALCMNEKNLRVVGQSGYEELQVACKAGYELPPPCDPDEGLYGFDGEILTGWHSGL